MFIAICLIGGGTGGGLAAGKKIEFPEAHSTIESRGREVFGIGVYVVYLQPCYSSLFTCRYGPLCSLSREN